MHHVCFMLSLSKTIIRVRFYLQTAMQECRMLQDAVEVLENESKSLSNRNKMLEGEVRRLANLIEHSQTDRVSINSMYSKFSIDLCIDSKSLKKVV